MKHGGKRKGSGRPSKYGEPTKQLKRNVPKSKLQEIAEKVDGILEEYKIENK